MKQISMDEYCPPPLEQTDNVFELLERWLEAKKNQSIADRVDFQNRIKLILKKYSPMNTEPVDCVLWVKSDLVTANDYNPNSVAPPRNETA